MELQKDRKIPFLDVLVSHEDEHINTSIFRKPTHTRQYIHRLSNHLDHVTVHYTLEPLAFVPLEPIYVLKLIIFIFNNFQTNAYSKKCITICTSDIRKSNKQEAEVRDTSYSSCM